MRTYSKIGLVAFVLLLFIPLLAQTSWEVPENYHNMSNPYQDDDASLIVAKSIYKQHCKSCHGRTGKGDGSAAEKLSTPCPDLTTSNIASQTDGDLFYKITMGRNQMPGFKKILADDEDRWILVNYIRSLNTDK